MEIIRDGYYTITDPKGNPLLDEDGDIRQSTNLMDCIEYVMNDPNAGDFTINCPTRTVKKKSLT